MQKFFALCVLAILFSCKKDAEILISSVRFSGAVRDSSTLEGIANVRIRMYWVNLANYKKTYIDSAITDTRGNYTINVNIDKSKFKTHHLDVIAVVPGDYIDRSDIDNSETGWSAVGIQSDELQLDIYMYRKAFLDILIKKTSNDTLSDFELHYGYQGKGFRNYWLIYKNYPVLPGDTIISVITAARMSTVVYWSKKNSAGAILSFKDSIRCLPGTNNIMTVNY